MYFLKWKDTRIEVLDDEIGIYYKLKSLKLIVYVLFTVDLFVYISFYYLKWYARRRQNKDFSTKVKLNTKHMHWTDIHSEIPAKFFLSDHILETFKYIYIYIKHFKIYIEILHSPSEYLGITKKNH